MCRWPSARRRSACDSLRRRQRRLGAGRAGGRCSTAIRRAARPCADAGPRPRGRRGRRLCRLHRPRAAALRARRRAGRRQDARGGRRPRCAPKSREVAREGVGAAELARVKTQWVASQTYKLDSVMAQARELGSNWVQGLPLDASERIIAQLQAVTAEQVQAVAAKYFGDDQLTAAVAAAAAARDPTAARAALPRLPAICAETRLHPHVRHTEEVRRCAACWPAPRLLLGALPPRPPFPSSTGRLAERRQGLPRGHQRAADRRCPDRLRRRWPARPAGPGRPGRDDRRHGREGRSRERQRPRAWTRTRWAKPGPTWAPASTPVPAPTAPASPCARCPIRRCSTRRCAWPRARSASPPSPTTCGSASASASAPRIKEANTKPGTRRPSARLLAGASTAAHPYGLETTEATLARIDVADDARALCAADRALPRQDQHRRRRHAGAGRRASPPRCCRGCPRGNGAARALPAVPEVAAADGAPRTSASLSIRRRPMC